MSREMMGLISMLAMTGMSPVDLLPANMRKHLRRDICVECLEKIPDGRAGRRCKKCRENDDKGVQTSIPVI